MNPYHSVWVLKLTIFLLINNSIYTQVSYVDREEARLDESIKNLYLALHKAQDLLVIPKMASLPNNTIVKYKGTYPNRSGIKLIKFNVIPDSLHPGLIKSSEEKSLFLEFNGSVLSRVEYSVTVEETGNTPKTITRIVDESPLDDDINNLEIHAYEGIIQNIIPLSSVENEGIRHNRNNFKKNFYIRLLQDSLTQITIIIQMQKKEGNSLENRRFNRLKESLNY